MKLMFKFYLWSHNFSDSKNSFSQDFMGDCPWCYFGLLFLSLAFRKYKKVCTLPKLFWYKVFVHGKPKVLDSVLDFVFTAR